MRRNMQSTAKIEMKKSIRKANGSADIKAFLASGRAVVDRMFINRRKKIRSLI
jgi:hypothetical protein